MAENDLKVIQKAKELATHTLKVTSNANRYPKKYRFSLVDKMQNKSMEIYEMLRKNTKPSTKRINLIPILLSRRSMRKPRPRRRKTRTARKKSLKPLLPRISLRL